MRLFHERYRLVSKIIDAETFTTNNATVVLQRRTEIITPMPRAKPVKLIKAASVGMIRILHAVVPFAESARNIAGGFESIADGLFIKIQPFTTCRSAVDATAHMITPGQKFRTRWRANWAYKEAIETRPVAGK